MLPRNKDGSGALAMLTYEQGRALGVLVLHSGVSEQKRALNVTLQLAQKRRVLRTFAVSVDPQESELGEVWVAPPRGALKALVRGRLQLQLLKNRRSVLQGPVQPALTCHVLQAILTPVDGGSTGYPAAVLIDDVMSDSASRPKSHRRGDTKNDNRVLSTGVAVRLSVTEKGKLEYQIQLNDASEISSLEIHEPSVTRKRTRPLCSVTGTRIQLSGSCGSVQADQVQSLYHSAVEVTVTSTLLRTVYTLTGLVHKVVYQQDSFQSGRSILLTGSGASPPVTTPLAGVAWLSAGRDCHVHFSMTLTGVPEPEVTLTPFLRDRLSGRTYTGDIMQGSKATGVIQDLGPELFQRLSVGLVVLGVATARHPSGELVANITLQSSCGERESPHRGLEERLMNDDEAVLHEHIALPDNSNVLIINQCNQNGIIYDSGQTWVPVDDACATCSCVRGELRCQQVICPPTLCLNPIDVPGDCCPHCPPASGSLDTRLSEETCYFEGDKRRHRYGTIFHPYVIPFGYQKCAVCSCSYGRDEVVCAQLPCPELHCGAEEAVRLRPDDCCQVCPDSAGLPQLPPQQDEQVAADPLSSILNMQAACTYRGEQYSDGSEWHPRLASYGRPENCVTCRCQAGRVSCSRTQCPDLPCDVLRQRREEGQCCVHCISET